MQVLKLSVRLVSGSAVACLLAVAGVGCDRSEDTTTIETQLPGGGNVAVDSDGGMVNIEGPDGNIQAGESIDLPENFPEDIPLPDGVTWNLVQNMSEGGSGGVTAHGMVKQSVAEVAEHMKKAIAAEGWTTLEMIQQEDQMEILNFNKGERTLSVTITESDDGTSLVISSR